MIGEFEYLILAASLRLADEAYGASIRREIEEATGAPCSIGALYTTLDRLETKGFIKTWMGEATSQRGGRAKRLVRLTPAGRNAASAFFHAVTRITGDIVWSSR
jgi:DNA-binding PadR family transcriptional regulator